MPMPASHPSLCVLDFAKSVAIVVQQFCACGNILSSVNCNSVIAIHQLDLHPTVGLIAADTNMFFDICCDPAGLP